MRFALCLIYTLDIILLLLCTGKKIQIQIQIVHDDHTPLYILYIYEYIGIIWSTDADRVIYYSVSFENYIVKI